jgi:ring-1,2-phenylacetyl-CoA epoxidase subunit PaaE
MSQFHPLTVADVRRETRDAVVLTLSPRDEDKALFNFTQGQYLTFRRSFEGEELRRCYSICAGTHEGVLRVGIKRVDGGAFSTWANQELKAGDVLEAMPPMGQFFTSIEPEAQQHYLGFAVGSGIAPILSIIKTVLAGEPRSRFTLVYANRQINSIMFREALEDLKSQYLQRLSVIHILKSEAQDIDLFTGRLDQEKIAELFKSWIDPKNIDTVFICGPEPMMLATSESLLAHGIPKERIKFELFASAPRRKLGSVMASASADKAAEMVEIVVTLDGTTRSFRMQKQGISLLEAAIENHIDAPYSCRAGVCSTCKAKVLSGEFEMEKNHALEDYEVRAGYVLTCQCHPLSDKLVVSYDE